MSTHRSLAAGACLLAGTLFSPSQALAAESYDGCVGYIDSLPAVISTQGTWCLRGDLSTGITSGAAIEVQANNATIDCNHFKIGGLAAGPTSMANGIESTQRLNVTVRRCHIRGFFNGLFMTGGGHLVEDNRFDGNLYSGISIIGAGQLVRNNRIYDTGGFQGGEDSIAMFVEGEAIDNVIDGVFADAPHTYLRGIYLNGDGSLARDNRIRGIAVAGQGNAIGLYSTGAGARLEGNHVVSLAVAAGWGIYAGNDFSTCTRNSVVRFAVSFEGCDLSLNNFAHEVGSPGTELEFAL